MGNETARHGEAIEVPENSSGEIEAKLLQRIGDGQGDALAPFYDRTARIALSLLVRILGDLAEAEEALQDLFLQVWREAARYCPERSSARGWLLMMARSRALDRLRSSQVRRRTQNELAERAGSVASAPLGTSRLEHLDRRLRIATALDHLPREQREAIELAFYQGMTHTQIAEHLGAPLGTVKSRVLLGMKKLRALLIEERGFALAVPGAGRRQAA
jgi:RNA polymerase sigma-70 factor (ECF subfamily)